MVTTTETRSETTTTTRYGGVSPVPHRPAVRGLEVAAEIVGPVPAAAAFPNFIWHGGPVVHFPKIFASFWGDAWLTDPDHNQRAGRLSQFLEDLPASEYMNVLSQYGAGAGAGSGVFVQASFVRGISGALTDAAIRSTIQASIDAGVIPEPAQPSNTCVMVYLAEGVGVGGPGDEVVMCEPTSDTAFGYHNFFVTTAGHKCYYSVIPGLDDACLRQSCSSDAGCSLRLSETQEQRQTQVSSHEFAEMVTDPELNAWFDGNGGENGDICNGQTDALTVGSNTWTVQRTYSRTDDVSTHGATICRTTAPAPIPALTPGPSGLEVAAARAALRPGSFDGLLPLPAVIFDAESRAVIPDEGSVHRYADRLFLPLQHQDVAPNLPRILHRLAEVTQQSAGAGLAAKAPTDPREKVFNGCFNLGDGGWFVAGADASSVVNGELHANVPGGKPRPFDVIVGQNGIPLQNGQQYVLGFTASADRPVTIKAQVQLSDAPFTAPLSQDVTLGSAMQRHTFTFTSNRDIAAGQVAFQIGGNPDPWNFVLDDVSLVGGDPLPKFVPDTGPRVRVNQVGYLPFGPKRATIVTGNTEPVPWQVTNSAAQVVASGTSTPVGLHITRGGPRLSEDPSSGQTTHIVDFSGLRESGTGYRLTADGETSHPFDIAPTIYDRLRSEALHFFYLQRSGIPIDDALAPGYARPAGHVGVAPNQGDTDVPCQPEADHRPDVRGGWYDAGDQGKYVVNGGIATYLLLSQYERSRNASVVTPGALDDGSLRVPEHGNNVPDILDEARWELEFLLRMQVPAGKDRAGMAHHKVHDDNWTPLTTPPDKDPQPRHLHEPSAAATLNLAAVAAQAARVYRPFDQAFADRCLAAARTAWAAAKANPAIMADPHDFIGGGAYDDGTNPRNLDDEFYWAAAELFITTGEQAFLDELRASRFGKIVNGKHTEDAFGGSGFSWQFVAGPGRLDLATVPRSLPAADRDAARASVLDAANQYLSTASNQAYGMPLGADEYIWGSNSVLLDKLVVVATAFDLTGDRRFRDGVLEGLDYIFGRNALNQSYVTGYGAQDSHNQHSRMFAHQLASTVPPPPPPPPPAGAIAGGPNNNGGKEPQLMDPQVARMLLGTDNAATPPAPQFCYVDDIQSFSTNEVAINWNAALAWVASFAADQQRAAVSAMEMAR